MSDAVVLRSGGSGEASAPNAVDEARTERVAAPPVIGDLDRARDRPVASMVSRYVVLGVIGHGGMGRVLHAYDPKLQREVALKEVRGDVLDRAAARRLVTEARAMAKLSHRNVVAVYDVEELPLGEVVLVMEYVAGQTLREWLAERDRPYETVVDCFVAAGRGLRAAHAAGLLHRDFKPSNVLLDEARSGPSVVKVTDFGLAKSSASRRSFEDAAGSEDVTRAGTIMGTPRYMAPEQHRGEPLTAAADQFSFCVAVWGALANEAPFSGDDLATAKHRGPPPWTGPPLPMRIVAALRRGLSPSPSDRWPDMEMLLSVLADDPARNRARWMVRLAGLGGIAVFGLGAQMWVERAASRCSGAQLELAEIWDNPRQDEVQTAFEATGAPRADAAWREVDREVGEYVSRWRAMHRDACEATTVRAEQSAKVIKYRMACLAQAKTQLSATLDVFADADVELVPRTRELLGTLLPLSRCADIEALMAGIEAPLPGDAEAVEEAQAQLAAVRANLTAGRYSDAHERLERARESMGRADYAPLRIAFALEEGDVYIFSDRYDDAERVLRAGLRHAAKWHQGAQMQEIVVQLMMIVGARETGMSVALRYLPIARGLSKESPLAMARVDEEHARILRAQGKYAEAEAIYRRTFDVWRQADVGQDKAARTLGTLAGVLYAQAKYEEADDTIAETAKLLGEVLGPDHPDVLAARGNRATLFKARGLYERAEAEYRAVLSAAQKRFGPRSPELLVTLNNLAILLMDLGRYDEAEQMHRRSLAMRREISGDDSQRVANSLSGLAEVHAAQGRPEEAEAEYREVLRIREAAFGPEHPKTGIARHNLAATMRSLGHTEEATQEFLRALAIHEKSRGPRHPYVGLGERELSELALARGDTSEALTRASRAWGIFEHADGKLDERAATAFVLAEAMWAAASDPTSRTRAEALAAEARSFYAGDPELYAEKLAGVTKWMAARHLLP